jgi:hypothetical protein
MKKQRNENRLRNQLLRNETNIDKRPADDDEKEEKNKRTALN